MLSDQCAIILCTAGAWLKDRDPKSADRFCKALVNRCGQTDLGRQANQLRWFPPQRQARLIRRPPHA